MTQGKLFNLDESLHMDTQQISESLNRIFNEGEARIVFWNDPEREFEENVKSLSLTGVTIIHQVDIPALGLKKLVELDDPEGRYLVYSPLAEPAPEKDWLLDIRLYSRPFRADRASMILNELGLTSQALRPYLSTRKAFFKSPGLGDKLKKLVSATDAEDDLDLKMMAVVAKADQPEFFSVLVQIFSAYNQDGFFDPDRPSSIWEEMVNFNLTAAFWRRVATNFGYQVESPKIPDLLARLLVTDFMAGLKADPPSSIRHFRLTPGPHTLNAVVFVSQWRNSLAHFKSFNLASKYFVSKLKIEDHIQSHDAEALLESMTFEVVERRIIRILKDRILARRPEEYDWIQNIIQTRTNGYWAGPVNGDQANTNVYGTAYRALQVALELFRLRNKYAGGIGRPIPEATFVAYTEELYLFDQYYRRYLVAADEVELAGWDVLKALQTAVEDCYCVWFMDQLSSAWGRFLEAQEGMSLLKQWSLPGIGRQPSFYCDYIKSALDSSSRNKVFVIISDALRYEAAEELTREINGKYRFIAKLEPMLGVLPSYTSLGMAALLPHGAIAYNDVGDVMVNGKPSSSLEQRSAILADYEGVAVRAEELLAMNKLQGRELVKPHRLIYIYHNQIDAIGDKQSSEHKAFEAVRKTLDEVGALVRYIINSLNGGYVLVTADHGFIYQDRSPDQLDKSALEVKPSGAVISKKRYILGKKLGRSAKVWAGNTKATAGTDDEMEFWVPKGTNRFHFTGGSRFFHGGAMLQEIVVPVVVVRELRGKAREDSAIRKVGVSLLGTVKKVVTNRHRFEFIQTDPVAERSLPRTIVVSLRDGSELISNEETITFDSESSSIDERKKSVMMTLKAKDYDSRKEYFLVLRDPGTEIEYDRFPIHIDLAIRDEF